MYMLELVKCMGRNAGCMYSEEVKIKLLGSGGNESG